MFLLVFTSGSVLAAEDLSGPRAVPTPEQVAWHDTEIGMFIHFAPNTWERSPRHALDKINPERLDTDQWVRVAESMGAKYIVFVANMSRLCMWQTDYRLFDHTAWRGAGRRPVDLSASCKARA